MLPCVVLFIILSFFLNNVTILWKFEARFCLFIFFGNFGFVNGGVVLGTVVGGLRKNISKKNTVKKLVVCGTDRSSSDKFRLLCVINDVTIQSIILHHPSIIQIHITLSEITITNTSENYLSKKKKKNHMVILSHSLFCFVAIKNYHTLNNMSTFTRNKL